MIEMERLAHRGWWKEAAEKNTRHAFKCALEAGFGIETDLRDHGGTVVISHDPPGQEREPEMSFADFLQLYNDSQANSTLALNIKADGLAAEIHRLLENHQVTRYFVFDMSVPDMLAYSRLDMPCFARQSEFESPVLLGEDPPFSPTRGIWLDSFSSIWYSTDLVGDHLASGLDVCLVSPELHGREPDPWWDELRLFRETLQFPSGQKTGNLMLCTDFPDKF